MMTTSERVIWEGKSGALSWKGKSGILYDFKLYRKEDCTEDIPCVYIYTYSLNDGDLAKVYVGQTEQLATRIRQHARREYRSCECIHNSGATHIGVYREGTEEKRREIERDIMNNYNWKCNQ